MHLMSAHKLVNIPNKLQQQKLICHLIVDPEDLVVWPESGAGGVAPRDHLRFMGSLAASSTAQQAFITLSQWLRIQPARRNGWGAST